MQSGVVGNMRFMAVLAKDGKDWQDERYKADNNRDNIRRPYGNAILSPM